MAHIDHNDRIHETTTEARAGSTPKMTRTILVVSTALVILLFLVIVLVGRA